MKIKVRIDEGERYGIFIDPQYAVKLGEMCEALPSKPKELVAQLINKEYKNFKRRK